MKLTLISVMDSGIVLEGFFSKLKDSKREQIFFTLKDIISIKRIYTIHTGARILGSIVIFSGATAAISSFVERPPEYGIGLNLLFWFSAIGSIPFLIHRTDLHLGEKWRLLIK